MTNMNSDLAHNYTVIKNELLEKGIAESVTWASSAATSTGWHRDVDEFPGKRPGETVDMGRINISEGYFETLGMTMKEGREFSGSGDTLNRDVVGAASPRSSSLVPFAFARVPRGRIVCVAGGFRRLESIDPCHDP